MRVLLALAGLAAAGAAAAQPLPGQPLPSRPLGSASEIQLQQQLDMMRAQTEMLRQRQVGIENNLNAMEANARTERNLSTLQAQTHPAPAPVILPGAPPSARLDLKDFAAIPDSRLADSNARVREAAGDHR